MREHTYPNPYPIEIFACGVNQNLAKKIADKLGLALRVPNLKEFSNGEFLIHQTDTVRYRDVYVICQPRQGNKEQLSYDLDECNSLVFSIKQGSPASITVVMPYLPYSRQDRATNDREPVLSQKIAASLQHFGANKLVVLKLHNESSYNAHPQTIPMELIKTDDLLVDYIQDKNFDLSKFKVVAPDSSAATYARYFSEQLGITNEIVIVYKYRDAKKANSAEAVELVGDPSGYNLIMIDDMADTFGTAMKGSLLLKERGAKDIYFAATHGILSGNAIENIEQSGFSKIWLTDTCPTNLEDKKDLNKLIEIIPTVDRIAHVIKNLHDGQSVSQLWKNKNNQ